MRIFKNIICFVFIFLSFINFVSAQNHLGVGLSYFFNLEIDPVVTYDAIAINGIYEIKKVTLQAGPLICRAIPQSKFKAKLGGDFRVQYKIITNTNFNVNVNYTCLYINHTNERQSDSITYHILHNNFGLGLNLNLYNQKIFATLNADYSFARYWYDKYPGNGNYNSLFIDFGLNILL